MSQPPPPPDSYQYQPISAFPSAGDALSAGWRFCKTNFWFVALLAGVASVFSVLVNLPSMVSNNPNQALVLVLTIASALVSVLLALGLLRRALDYWDETNGRAQPREFSEAFSAAIEGATPRVLPWIGWNLLIGVVIGIIFVPVLLVVASGGSGGLALVLLLISIVVLLAAAVYLAFVSIAIADGPGNPLTTSVEVVRGHFWTIVGTYLLLVLLTIAAYIPIAIVLFIAVAIGGQALGAVVGFILMVVLVTVIEAVGLGAVVTMYRSVIKP